MVPILRLKIIGWSSIVHGILFSMCLEVESIGL